MLLVFDSVAVRIIVVSNGVGAFVARLCVGAVVEIVDFVFDEFIDAFVVVGRLWRGCVGR